MHMTYAYGRDTGSPVRENHRSAGTIVACWSETITCHLTNSFESTRSLMIVVHHVLEMIRPAIAIAQK